MLPIDNKTLETTVNSAKNLFSKLFGSFADEYGLILADDMKIRRLKNQIKNLKKIQAIVEKENINIKQVDLKVLVPYISNVSLEESESLQDIWANLMTNYLDASKHLTSSVYPSILSQLSTNDLQVIDFMTKDNQNRFSWIKLKSWGISYLSI